MKHENQIRPTKKKGQLSLDFEAEKKKLQLKLPFPKSKNATDEQG